jgi:exodeoxyribonuclease V
MKQKANPATARTVTGPRLDNDPLGGAIEPENITSSPASKFVWSTQQSEALARIYDWQHYSTKSFFYLSGFAGTGKTTLTFEIARRTNGTVLFAALSAKAAGVMREKGCTDATTIDSLIYRPMVEAWCARKPPCEELCNNRCRHLREQFVGRTLNNQSDVVDADLVIIDEVSMVGEEMGEDLLSFGTPVLVLGDIAQLPPINSLGFFTRGRPDFQLTQVHRQALGSPVIELATRARNGRRLQRGTYGDSAVIDDIETDDLLNHDQVICGTHRTRHRMNKQMRRRLGFKGATPERGEKVICLRNNAKLGLRNGEIWTVTKSEPLGDGFVMMTVEDGDGKAVEVISPVEGFTSYDASGADLPENPFAFAYAITCHKSQGSQWGSVLVIDESRVFRQHRWKWLYTAITRAAQRVTVVMP